jgi:hypothetical protein
MKIRQGFVSNSSSSSFVVRGLRMKIKDLAKQLDIDPNKGDLFNKVYNKFGYAYGKEKVVLESTRYYFSDEDANSADVIVGVTMVDLNDGVVGIIPDVSDLEMRQKIENKIGSIGKAKLQTFIQFVSNDNY